jgi:hypothetical protein
MAKSFITERDIRLFESLHGYALMTTSQIQSTHFRGTDLHTVLRRLRNLERRHLIQRHHGLSHGKLCWTAAKKGLALVGASTPILVNRNTIEHDIQLTEVRLTLDRLGIGKQWRGNHELRMAANENKKPDERSADLIPDSLFAVMKDQQAKLIALEVELTAKSRKRYRRILDLYSDKKSINHIWYVVRPSKLGPGLLLEATKVQRSLPNDWLVWTLIEDLLENGLNSKVHFQNEKYLLLREFFPPSKSLGPRISPPTRSLTP